MAWGIHHRLSSAEYPQSNGWAELAVKTAKCIFLENMHDSLDREKMVHALLQYGNTTIQNLALSQAQLLFHQQLQDHLPSEPINYHLTRK